MNQLLFLKPIFHEKIWGGNRLKTVFNYTIPNSRTGECWAISAHKNGDCEIINGELAGKKLSDVWQNHRELFGNVTGDVFPLMIKILDASDDLSVQVHPNDEYALQNEGELGKTECWYILDADSDAELIFGHHAKTKEEFIKQVEAGNWDELLQRVKVKKGDFLYVPAGTIHALKKGTLVLETQQSSDTTYRLYDYDRICKDGCLRPLHLKPSIDVATIPHQETEYKFETIEVGDNRLTSFLNCDYFSVSKWEIRERYIASHEKPFSLVSVLEGEGSINDINISKGDHFIIPATVETLEMDGNLELIISSL